MENKAISPHLFEDSLAVTVLKCVCILLTVTGNGVVILAVTTNTKLRQVPNNLLICSLALSDFLVGGVVMVADTVSTHLRSFKPQDTVASIALFRVRLFLMVSSAWNICIVSVDRCVYITFATSYLLHRSRVKVVLLCSLAWIIAGLITVLMHIHFTSNPKIDDLINAALVFIAIQVPMLITTIADIKLIHFINKLGGLSLSPGDKSTGFLTTARLQSFKKTRILSLLIFFYYVLWGPVYGYCIYMLITREKYNYHILHLVSWLGYVNSLVNPYIYAVVNVKFRNAIASTLLSKCPCGQYHQTEENFAIICNLNKTSYEGRWKTVTANMLSDVKSPKSSEVINSQDGKRKDGSFDSQESKFTDEPPKGLLGKISLFSTNTRRLSIVSRKPSEPPSKRNSIALMEHNIGT